MRPQSRSLSPARGDSRLGKSRTSFAASRLLQPTLSSSSKAKQSFYPNSTNSLKGSDFRRPSSRSNVADSTSKSVAVFSSAPAMEEDLLVQSTDPNPPARDSTSSFKGKEIRRPSSRSNVADSSNSSKSVADFSSAPTMEVDLIQRTDPKDSGTVSNVALEQIVGSISNTNLLVGVVDNRHTIDKSLESSQHNINFETSMVVHAVQQQPVTSKSSDFSDKLDSSKSDKALPPSAPLHTHAEKHRQAFQRRDRPMLKGKRTFADVAAGKSKPSDVFAANFTAIRPIKQGNFVSISIPDSIYQEQLNLFRFSIIGRMIHRKGDSPLAHEELKKELGMQFGFLDSWSLIAMGRGFFTLKLGSESDLSRVASLSSVRCSVGIMYFREWSSDFDPIQAQSSVAHIWVKVYHLPAFYWHPEVLTGILSAAGNVVKLDGNTMSGAYGKFARALVEVDMAQPLLESVMVGCGASSFFVSLAYENLPAFCPICQVVGHGLDKCRRNKSVSLAKDDVITSNEAHPPNKSAHIQDKEWIVKRDRRRKDMEQLGKMPVTQATGSGAVNTHNSFELLNADVSLGDLGEEATFADYLDKVTVPVEEYNAKVSSCSIEVQRELSNIDMQLQKLEKKMKAEQLAKAVVANDVSKGATSSLVPFKAPPSYDQLKANLDEASSAASSGLKIVRERLSQASLLGVNPTEFTVVSAKENQGSSLDLVARRRWADLEDSDEEDGSRVSPSETTQSLQ